MTRGLPTKDVLWRGAILGGIVNAVAASQYSQPQPLHGWIRNHYMIKGGDGRDGIVTFAGGHWYPNAPVVALFYNIHSDRYNNQHEVALELLFANCPPYQRSLAEQEAIYFLQTVSRGKLLHHVTAIVWDKGESLVSADDWDTLMLNGVDLISNELIANAHESLLQFQEDYELSDPMRDFIGSLAERKLARPASRIILSEQETRWLRSVSSSEIANENARIALRQLDIY